MAKEKYIKLIVHVVPATDFQRRFLLDMIKAVAAAIRAAINSYHQKNIIDTEVEHNF